MKFIEREWALVNKKDGTLYRAVYGSKAIITFFSRDDAREEKADIVEGNEYKVEKVKVTYERIHVS